MSKYFVRPRAAPEGSWDDPLLPHLSVNEHIPIDTRLVDKAGNPIMRVPEPVGFHQPKVRR